MKANPGKHYLLLSSIKCKIFPGNKWEKCLGTKIRNNLNFKGYIESMYEKLAKSLMVCLDLHP